MPEVSEKALVSVVIPSYNASKYIETTIRSVLAQTYTRIEIILVNDGSTDDTAEIVKPFIDSNQIIYISQLNGGVSSARNTGINRASGEFICCLDADDWMYPDNVQEKISCLQEKQADMVFSWAEVTDANLVMTEYFKGADVTDFGKSVFVFSNPPVPSPSSAIVRKTALMEVGLFDTRLSVSADLDMWIRLSFNYKIVKVEKPLIKYRLMEGSMHSDIRGMIDNVEHILAKYKNNKPLQKRIRKYRKDFYYSVVGNAVHTRNPKNFVKYLVKYFIYFF